MGLVNMKWLIATLISATLLIAGCTQTSSSSTIGTTNFRDVATNPQSYLNKTVTLVGILDFGPSNSYGIIDYTIDYADNQGYHYSLNLESYKEQNRQLFILENYKVKGILKVLDICNCEEIFSDIQGDCVSDNLKSKPNIEGGYWYYDSNYSDWLSGMSEWRSDLIGQIIMTDCPYGKNETYYCNLTKYYGSTQVGQIVGGGIFVREYRCNPDSIGKVYYIEGTEPMVKIS